LEFDGPVLVNVFASWCVPCRAEHAVLTRMVQEDGLNLVGINYKNDPSDAAAWLAELGNPYSKIGSDINGRAGIEWGISGVPETFIVDGNGVVVFRYVGPILTDAALASIRQELAQAEEDTP
jgi:cytochrome c biogenesis protein CcmG/thiol:disulfide interchange protein DsbE